MRVAHWAIALAVGWSASLFLPPAAFAARFKPPTIDEPKALPDVWFGQRLKDGRWCAFPMSKMKSLAEGGSVAPTVGWARYENGNLASVTVAIASQDSATDDRYLFDGEHRIQKLIRTGHYINDPWASFTFAPDTAGKLKMTPEAKALEAKMTKADYEPYFVDWPIYASFEAIPFSELVDWRLGASVRLGCAKRPKPIDQD